MLIAYIHVCACTKALQYWFKLGMSSHPPPPTEPDLLPIKLTSLAMGDGFLPPKPDFDGLDVSLLLQNLRNPN